MKSVLPITFGALFNYDAAGWQKAVALGSMRAAFRDIISRVYHEWLELRMVRNMRRYAHSAPEDLLNARNRNAGFSVAFRDFSCQKPADRIDRSLLERILLAYRLSKREQPRAGPYCVRGMWETILAAHYAELIDAARKGDTERIGAYLQTVFMRGSRGLSMSGDVPDFRDPRSVEGYVNNYVDTLLRLATFLNLAEPTKDADNEGYVFQHRISLQDLWKQIARAAEVDPSYPRLGSLFGLKVRVGSEIFVVPRVAARHVHAALRIRDLAADLPARFLEIGGGFGGVQYYLAQTIRKPFLITSLDVPEINMISAYFLTLALPNVEVVLHGENGSGRKKRVIHIEPNWELRDIESNTMSVVVNCDSLPEIPRESFLEYLRRIGKICKYFYSENHDCGQNRLSQVHAEDFGLRCIDHNIAWMRHGYFERVYQSISNAS